MPNLSKAFSVQKDETNIGSFLLSHCGIAKHFHSIVSNESIFHCYSRSIDLFNYLSIYDTHTDKQIALLETYLTVVDNNYKFKLYLLDEYAAHTDVFALFILYYANFHFTQRFHMSAGTTSTRSWTFSGFNSKYDPDWRAKYFPNDNFWGKIDPYET